MAHSIELLFDERTEDAIRRCWSGLELAGLPSQSRVRSQTNRPHVTLLAADRIPGSVDTAVSELAALLPLECTVGASLLFGTGRFVLARLIVPTAGLLEMHRAVVSRCASHVTSALPHSAPNRWTPHCTLARRLSVEQVAEALEAAGAAAALSGTFTALRRWDGDARQDLVYLS